MIVVIIIITSRSFEAWGGPPRAGPLQGARDDDDDTEYHDYY